MRTLVRPALLLAGLLLIGALVRLLTGGGAGDWLTARIDPGNPATILLFVAAGAVFCAAGIPRQVVAYSAGLGFGVLEGTALALVAQVTGCAIDFLWARLVARDQARAFMRRRAGGRLARLDDFLSASPFAATLMLRLVPVGNNLILNLLAGASGVAGSSFILASAIGYLPQTLTFALLGGGIRVDQSVQVGLAVALFASSAVVGIVLLRRLRAQGPLADG